MLNNVYDFKIGDMVVFEQDASIWGKVIKIYSDWVTWVCKKAVKVSEGQSGDF